MKAMEHYLVIRTRDELLRVNIGKILYFEADKAYTKLLLSGGLQFTISLNIGKIEAMLERQVTGSTAILSRVGKSYIINKNHILQISVPKQRLLMMTGDGRLRELTLSKVPLKVLKKSLEKRMETEVKNKKENEAQDREGEG
ncbi:Response regulator of the LytR/AlgR family protein [Bacteroidales bacterium Barb6XT]|nr:Response regulator of the LytR/AlgR family protein [Bacteroidales bacterium Barb6XT]